MKSRPWCTLPRQPGTRRVGQGPGLLDLDLEQLLKWAGTCQGLTLGPETTLEKKKKKTEEDHLLFLTPSHTRDLTQARFLRYSPKRVFYFSGRDGFLWTVLCCSHSASPLGPQPAAPRSLRGSLEHRQRPCRQSSTPAGFPPPVSVRDSSPRDVPLYFAFILWYYTLVDLLFYK